VKFHSGNFPESKEFVKDENWHSLGKEEKSIWILQIKVLPVAIINIAFTFFLWYLISPLENILRSVSFPLPVFKALLIILVLLIVHELIHLLSHPKFGLSSRSILGFWPSKMFLYVAFDGELKRNRSVFIFLMPLIIINLSIFLYSVFFKQNNFWLIYITIVNAFLSSMDILAAITILKLPNKSIIRSNGNMTYWKKHIS